jgi:hypothetical protein
LVNLDYAMGGILSVRVILLVVMPGQCPGSRIRLVVRVKVRLSST